MKTNSDQPSTNAQARERPRPRWKTWLFRSIAVAIVYLVAEGAALFGLHFTDAAFSFRSLYNTQEKVASGMTLKRDSNETIHPYTGWTFNPQISDGVEFAGQRVPVNDYGFLDKDAPIPGHSSSDDFVVAITGGSVAFHVSVVGEEIIRKTLLELPELAGRHIKIVNLALPGFKQPQQLMALLWLQSLGAKYDAVINIDGFNETVLTIRENARSQVHIAYPRSWHSRTQDIVDPREFSLSYDLLRVRAARQRLARNAVHSWFRWSPLYSLIWLRREQALNEYKADLNIKVIDGHSEEGKGIGRSFASAGPDERFQDQDELHSKVVDLWLRSSRQMHYACESSGTIYLHALQPNQYVKDSKTFTQEEYECCWSPTMEEAKTMIAVYPLFISKGPQLNSFGVHYRDMTQVFVDTKETVYLDPWCHYNTLGNQILAKAIADELVPIIRSRLSN